MILTDVSIAFSAVFLLVVISYYALALLPRRRSVPYPGGSIAILIPARNEAAHVRDGVESVLAARWHGTKEVYVIDDASGDGTSEALEGLPITILRNETHLGKSRSLNRALAQTDAELVCVVDADSVIAEDSLEAIAAPLSDPKVVGATSIIGVRNRNRLPNPFVHLELLYGSLIRSILAKINGNVITPGPLSCYRAIAVRSVGGFPTDVYSEDIDLTVRLIRAGHRIAVSERARVDTVMPTIPREFVRQRLRFARGMVFILKRHLQVSRRIIDLYTIPLLLFTYLQSTIMGAITVVRIVQGFGGVVHSGILVTARYLIEWLSLAGIVRWAIAIATGHEALTLFAAVGLLSSLLAYPLYIYAVARYDTLTLRDLLAIFFLPLYWLALSGFYLVAIGEVFVSRQENRWKKNEA